MTIDLAKLKKLTEECHEVTVMWFTEAGRPVDGSDSSGSPTLMGQLLQHIDELTSLVALAEPRKDLDAQVEKALQTVIHWTTDFASQTESKKNTIVSGLRDFCGDALKKMRGEREQTPEERIIYLERALGSIAHTCSNNPKPQQIPYQVRGIVERAIRGIPNPIRAADEEAPPPPRISGIEDRPRSRDVFEGRDE